MAKKEDRKAYEQYKKLERQNEAAQASEYASDELKKAFARDTAEARKAAEEEAATLEKARQQG